MGPSHPVDMFPETAIGGGHNVDYQERAPPVGGGGGGTGCGCWSASRRARRGSPSAWQQCRAAQPLRFGGARRTPAGPAFYSGPGSAGGLALYPPPLPTPGLLRLSALDARAAVLTIASSPVGSTTNPNPRAGLKDFTVPTCCGAAGIAARDTPRADRRRNRRDGMDAAMRWTAKKIGNQHEKGQHPALEGGQYF